MIRANASRYPISAQCRILGVPRSTYYWMTGHPETEHVDPIAGDVRAVRRDSRGRYGARKIKAVLERKGVTASRRRIGGIMREQSMTSAYTRRRSKPHGMRPTRPGSRTYWTAGPTATPRTRVRRAILPMSASAGGGWAYVCLLVGLADRGIAGHSAGRARDTGLVLAAFATLDFPLTDVQVFHTEPGQRIRQHEVRRAARRVRHQKIAAAQGQPLRQRRGRIDEQAAEEGARVPEPLHHDRAAEA